MRTSSYRAADRELPAGERQSGRCNELLLELPAEDRECCVGLDGVHRYMI